MQIEKLIDRYFTALDNNYISKIKSATTIDEINKLSFACDQVQIKFESKFVSIANTEYYQKQKYDFAVNLTIVEFKKMNEVMQVDNFKKS